MVFRDEIQSVLNCPLFSFTLNFNEKINTKKSLWMPELWMLKRMQRRFILVVNKSPKDENLTNTIWMICGYTIDVWHFVTTCHLTPAYWMPSSYFPPDVSGSPCQVSDPEGEREAGPSRRPFWQKFISEQKFFGCFLLRLFRLLGNRNRRGMPCRASCRWALGFSFLSS